MEFAERLKEKPPCEQCRLTWKVSGSKPDCEKCLPRIHPGNEEILRVYIAVQNQVRTAGMDGTAISLDHNAVWTIIEKYKVANPLDVFEKVNKLFHHLRADEMATRRLKK